MTKSSVQCGYLSPEIVADKASQVAKDLGRGPSLSQVQCGASLATLGHITQVKVLCLRDLDISLLSASDLSSLVKCSSFWVEIERVTGDLAPVLSSLQCRMLYIFNTSLTTADTQQLVAAMDTRVKEVTLESGITLDIETLAQYNGMGECEKVIFRGESSMRYKNQAKVWAGNMGWRIEEANTGDIFIKKK